MVTFDAAHPARCAYRAIDVYARADAGQRGTATALAATTPGLRKQRNGHSRGHADRHAVADMPCVQRTVHRRAARLYLLRLRALPGLPGRFLGLPRRHIPPQQWANTRATVEDSVQRRRVRRSAFRANIRGRDDGLRFLHLCAATLSRGIIAGYPCGGVGEPCIAPDNGPTSARAPT